MGSLQNDLTGNTFSSNALTGRTAVSLLRNQGYASRVVSMRVSEQDVTDASRQVGAARSEAVAASSERSTILSEAFTRGLNKLRSSRSSSGSTSSSFEQVGETLNRLDQIAKGVADSTGLSQAQVASIAFGASGRLGLDAGFAGASVHSNGGKAYQSSLTADERKVLSVMSSEQLAEFKQFGDRVSRDASVMSAITSESRETRDMASRLASTTARSERAEASLAERTTFAERVSAAYERGEIISIDIAQDPHNLEMFTRYAEQYGGDSAAAHTLMGAELARQSLRPNRVFSDGTALPSSFGDLRSQHARERGDAVLAPDVAARHRKDEKRVSRFGDTVSQVQTVPTPSPIRDEVQTRGAQIRSGADSSSAGFDSKAEIVETDDGTLATRKSLLKQSGKQVAKDAGASVDNVKDVVKDLLKKK
jgi:conjugal transfer mating pair stabilization protein TraG